MLGYVAKRIVVSIFTVFIVATLTFFIMNLVPGGPFLSERAVTKKTQEAMERKYGLDRPLFERYLTYMGDLLKGDMGPSLKKRGFSVNDLIRNKFPVSALLGFLAVIPAMLFGVSTGCIAAYKRGSFIDKLILVFSSAGVAVPGFLIGTMLLYVLSVKLKLLPSMGLNTPASYIMPVIALSLYPACFIARLTRSSMLEVIGQDYMRTARAKGLSEPVILFWHGLRNAILPVVTYMGPLLAYLMTGSFIVENIFTIPGLGSEFVSSISSRDYPLIMGTTIFLAVFLILMNAIVDIASAFIDPRLRTGLTDG